MTVHCFSDFELDLGRRRLTRRGAEMRLGSRAFDILVTLVENAGEIVEKNDLLEAVWPDVHVEEGSLRVHLVALRKVLRDTSDIELIQNVAGRGYRFLGAVETKTAQQAPAPPQQHSLQTNLPPVGPSLIGRTAFIDSFLATPLAAISTIIGPAGIGKTSVALEIAHRLEARMDLAYFMDLATLADPRLVSSTLASLLGLTVTVDDPFPGIVDALGTRRVLLVLDNCEPLIEAVARLAERLLRALPNLLIVATSREPMRIESERVLQLPPLSIPSEYETVHDLKSFAAIELFADRVALLSDEDCFGSPARLAEAGGIVRKLDGIPLAIELAASRAAEFGLTHLAQSLEFPLKALRKGHRFAPARQQTLRAALDWSFDLLEPDEQRLLGMLSVFAGHFRFEAALAVVGDHFERAQLELALEGLILKSMLPVTAGGGHFKLLETTREYARDKLDDGELQRELARSHALYCRDELRAADEAWGALSAPLWQARFGDLIHDVRLAINWSLIEARDPALGIELSSACGLLMSQLGLLGEQLEIVREALVASTSLDQPFDELEMKLHISAGSILYGATGADGDDEAMAQFARAVEIAGNSHDAIGYCRAASGLSVVQATRGEYQEAASTIQRFDELYGETLPGASSRVHAHLLHYMGRFDEMREQAARAYAREENSLSPATNGASLDLRLSLGGVLSKSEWILGEIDRAVSMIDDVINDPLTLNHPVSACLFLAGAACPVLFAIGDRDRGQVALDLLRRLATQNSLRRWLDCADAYKVVTHSGVSDEALALIPSLRPGSPEGPLYDNLVVLAGTKLPIGFVERSLEQHAGWCRAELYRIRGEHLRKTEPETARNLFLRGISLAREQSALTWELRNAISLFETPAANSATEDRIRLAAVLDRSRQQLTTVDGRRAAQLLEC